MPSLRLTLIGLTLLTPTVAEADTTVEDIRVWSESGKTRVVLDLSRPAQHNIFTLRAPERLVVDLKDGRISESLKRLPTGTGAVKGIRTGVRANGQLRVVLDLHQAVRSKSFTAGPNDRYGDRLVIDLQRQGSLQAVKRASEGVYGHGLKRVNTPQRHSSRSVIALTWSCRRRRSESHPS